MNTSEVHPVDAVLPPGQKFLIGLQHVQVMCGTVIVAGLVTMLVAPVFSRLLRFFPRVGLN